MQPPMVKSAPAICNVHSGMRTFRDQAVFLLVGRSEGVEVAILLEIFVYKRRRHLLRGEHRFLYAWLGAACLASWRRMRGLRYSRPVYLSTLPPTMHIGSYLRKSTTAEGSDLARGWSPKSKQVAVPRFNSC